MAVMKMTLDSSHFVSKEGKKTAPPVAPTRTPTLHAPSQINVARKKKASISGVVIIGIIVLLVSLVFIGKSLIAHSGLTPAGIGSIIPALKPKLATDSEGKTNIMLVGIDTRETGTVEMNTDTIILGSYDEKTNRLAMLSYPRDLAVSYPGRTELTRINAIYAIAENSKKGTGLEKLKEVVQTVSGKTIQYYAMVDLKGFMDAIDIVGGVDVYLENDISGLYPTEHFQYERVSFAHGWNHMDGQSALEYSRIRKEVIPASEGSDFGRAKRQQKIIQAVIDKVSKTETLQDAGKVFGLVSVASKNLKMSKVSVEDIQAGVNILKDKGKPSSFSYVLDLYAGGDLAKLIDVINFNPYLLGPVIGANKWTNIQTFTKLYFTEPMLTTMNKDVVIYTDGSADASSKANAFKKKYYFVDMTVTSKNSPGISTKGFVYPIGGKTYEDSAKFVAEQLGLQFKAEIPEELKSVDASAYSIVAVY